MCGLNGILRLRDDAPAIDRGELHRTRDAMTRRGPDGAGEWFAEDGRIAFGHRRLAILDLSDASAQPMTSEDGRYVLVYNGELYNYRELRHELEREGARFHTDGDTEVLLRALARWDTEAFPRLRGMYAFALWDEHEKRLLLARDPYGIKPLYTSAKDGTLRFASQVKALLAGGTVSSAVDREGLAGFLLWGSVPEPWTIREEVRALPAGSWLEARDGKIGEPVRHHRFDQSVEPRNDEPVDPAAAVRDSIRAHLVSDVPVGVFLSAGLDSAMVAAVAAETVRQAGGGPLASFTLRFDEYRGTNRDEGPLAAEVARILGTEHHEWAVTPDQLRALWPRALEAMDQPSIDGINSFVVSKLAADHGYKVVLSGLGGDELFGGYDSFRDVPRWHRWGRRLAAVPGLRGLWPRASRLLRPGLPKLPGLLDHAGSWAGAYYLRRGLFLPQEVAALVGGEGVRWQSLLGADEWTGDSDPWCRVHALESTTYLRNQLLRDADWASMAWSLELRVPLVDARLRQQLATDRFAALRHRGKPGILRALAPGLPDELTRRPKSGFSVPTAGRLSGLRPASDGEGSRTVALRVARELELLPAAVEAAA